MCTNSTLSQTTATMYGSVSKLPRDKRPTSGNIQHYQAIMVANFSNPTERLRNERMNMCRSDNYIDSF